MNRSQRVDWLGIREIPLLLEGIVEKNWNAEWRIIARKYRMVLELAKRVFYSVVMQDHTMAPRWKRLLAFVVDVFLSIIVGSILLFTAVTVMGALDVSVNINLTQNTEIIGCLAFSVGYLVINTYLLFSSSRSIGKKALRIKISGSTNGFLLLLRCIGPLVLSYYSTTLAILTFALYLPILFPVNRSVYDYIFNTKVTNA